MTRRRAARPALLVPVLVVAACSSSPSAPPTVTLASATQTVTADATRWCASPGRACSSHRVPVPAVQIKGRADLTVDVGDIVAKRPWIVLVEGGSASPLQRSRTFRLVAVRAPVTVEVVTVDTDGTRVLQRDRWVFKVQAAK